MYTIGQVSERTGLPISTLRYYDKEGLFPHMERVSGARRFSERELEALRVIECLKASGLEIRDIRQFMQWCTEGAGSYPKRRELLERQKETLEAQMDDLRRSLAMLQFKCWYYEQAMQDEGAMDPLINCADFDALWYSSLKVAPLKENTFKVSYNMAVKGWDKHVTVTVTQQGGKYRICDLKTE